MQTARTFGLTILLLFGSLTVLNAKPLEIIQTHEAQVGERLFIKLPGNPKSGYDWKINESESKGLDKVSVEKVGWLMAQQAKSMFFQEASVLNVSIMANSPGLVDLAFDYFRYLGGRRMSKTSIVRVVFKP